MRIGHYPIVLIGLLASCLLGPMDSYASRSPVLLAANDSRQNQVRPGKNNRQISKQQAASNAKRQYPGSKILSAKLIGGSGPAVYRLKMLSPKGVVKYVFVDGKNGSVFE
jgi:uncharacterized membrane protein YkoI